jgi:hypothetical protein
MGARGQCARAVGRTRYTVDSKAHVVYLYRDIDQLKQYITA